MNELVVFAIMYAFAIVFHYGEHYVHRHRKPKEGEKKTTARRSAVLALCAIACTSVLKSPPTIEAGKHYFVHVVIASVLH